MDTPRALNEYRATRLLSLSKEIAGLNSLLNEASAHEKLDDAALANIIRDLERAMDNFYAEAIWIRNEVQRNSKHLHEKFVKELNTAPIDGEYCSNILKKLPNAESLSAYVSSSVQLLINNADVDKQRLMAERLKTTSSASEAQATASRRICMELGIGFGAALLTANEIAAAVIAGMALGYGCFDSI